MDQENISKSVGWWKRLESAAELRLSLKLCVQGVDLGKGAGYKRSVKVLGKGAR